MADVAELDPELREEAEGLARELVHGGFETFDDIVVAVTEHFDPDEEPVTPAQATAVVEPIWSARQAEQRAWPQTTDADRVLGAFAALEARGIVARPHFTCCGGCGTSEIGGHAAPDSRGYVFFHQQDTARAAEGQGLMLAYGSLRSREAEDTAAIGHEVVAALTAAGLPVQWDGSVARRIGIMPLDWRKRLPA